MDKRLLNVKETAEYLGIGLTKCRELLRGRNGIIKSQFARNPKNRVITAFLRFFELLKPPLVITVLLLIGFKFGFKSLSIQTHFISRY